MPDRFVIKRRDHFELSVVGRDGQKHGPYSTPDKPKGRLITDEGQYRRAIKDAVQKNGGGHLIQSENLRGKVDGEMGALRNMGFGMFGTFWS